MNSEHSTRTALRRSATLTAGTVALLAASVAVSGPASAGVPDGWAPANQMSWGELALFCAGIPLLAGLVIAILVLLPGVLRGDGLIPKVEESPDHPELERHAGH